jgi:arylsulfatase A-like enzyme
MIWWLLWFGCAETSDLSCDPAPARDIASPREADPVNLLLVILDDVGPELVGAYDVQPQAPRTPVMDELASTGARFDHAYSTPWCSSTRAELLTGRYAIRFGLGMAVWVADDEAPSLGEASSTSFPELLDDRSPFDWSTGQFGKWHLTTLADGAVDAPLRHGFDRQLGNLGNLTGGQTTDGGDQDYFNFEWIDDGVPTRRTGYVTNATMNAASDWTANAPEPWFAWVALHSAHTPWHTPPDHEHDPASTLDPTDTPYKVRAMVEDADRQLGRLLDEMDPELRSRTVVVVVGDNGSSDNAAVGEFVNLPGKSSVYEGGISVPLIVNGPVVAEPGEPIDAWVSVTDVFATFAELAGIDPNDPALGLDGVSFLPHLTNPNAPSAREWIVANEFSPNGPGEHTRFNQAIRGPRFKVVRSDSRWETFDMQGRIREADALPNFGIPDEAANYRAILKKCFIEP